MADNIRSANTIIQAAIDGYINEQSSFYEAAVRPYLPAISARIINSLSVAGYKIVAPTPPKPKPPAPRARRKTAAS